MAIDADGKTKNADKKVRVWLVGSLSIMCAGLWTFTFWLTSVGLLNGRLLRPLAAIGVALLVLVAVSFTLVIVALWRKGNPKVMSQRP